jgi:uncharacterized protein (TIGR03435 family)
MRNEQTLRGAFLLTIAGIVAISAAYTVRAQAPTPDTKPPAFEVASVKPHNPDDQQVMMVAQPGGRFVARNIPLRLLIRTAYRLQDDQVLGGPKWLASDRFDIVAKAEEGAHDPPDERNQLAEMIQALLTDRFKLEVHHETKELPIYALALARTDGALGSQLRRNECERVLAAPDASQPRPCGSISNGTGRLSFRGTPMPQILQFLSPAVNRVVVDRTGLTGRFDLDLEWTPDQLREFKASADRPPGSLPQINGVPFDPNGPSIFTALQEQLGLKLESTKGPVDVLVIDHAEQPTPD